MPTPSQTDTHTHTHSPISIYRFLPCVSHFQSGCLYLSLFFDVCVCDSADEMCVCVLRSCSASPDRTLAPTANTAKMRGGAGKDRRGGRGRHGTSSAIHFFLSLLRNIYNMKPQSMTDPQILFLLSSTVSAGE